MKWLVLSVLLVLTACGPLKTALSLGSGPKVAANVQAGAENEQDITVGVSNESDQRIVRPRARSIEQSTGETKVRSEKVDTVVVEAASDWMWIVIAGALFGLIVGWIIPTPKEIMRK